MRSTRRLPARFPDGAKYVLESDGGTVRRYVEFPDGRRVTLASRKAMTCCAEQVSIVPAVTEAAAPRKRRTAHVLAHA
jgi:hypothetical protein